MKISRKKKETDKGKRVSYVQSSSPTSINPIISNGMEIKNPENRINDFSFINPMEELNSSKEIQFNNRRKLKIKYIPNKYFYVDGNTLNALDETGRQALFIHKSTEKAPIKKVYRNFLKDTEKALELGEYPKGTIDKELREAIKKEIRKQHKIHNIKKVSKLAIPTTLAITGGAYLYNKRKDENIQEKERN